MKTITDALKTFYAKLGGDVSKLPSRTTSADIIEAMSDVYTDKEGTHVEVTTQVTEGTKIATVKTNNEDHDIYAPIELPSVKSSDEGKVLTVDNNGNWAKGSIPLIVSSQLNAAGTQVTLDDTFSDVLTSLIASKRYLTGIPMLQWRWMSFGGGTNGEVCLPLTSQFRNEDNQTKLIFAGFAYNESGVLSYMSVEFNNSTSGTITKYTMTPAT